jgi:Predicted exonuclease of the beta-lactamase fold involved in RNA processing
MYVKTASSFITTYTALIKHYKCPFCISRFETDDKLSRHIIEAHAHAQAFFLVNGVILDHSECSFEKIESLAFLNYGDNTVTCSVLFDNNTIATAVLDSHNRMVDLTQSLKQYIVNQLRMEIHICGEVLSFIITQHLNILDVTEDQIHDQSYRPSYFYRDVSEGRFGLPEYRVFLSMLAHDNDYESAEMLNEKVSINAATDSCEDIIEFYLYYSLLKGESHVDTVKRYCTKEDYLSSKAVLQIMNLQTQDAIEEFRSAGRAQSNFHKGSLLLLAYLSNDVASIHYYEQSYVGAGVLNDILALLKCFRDAAVGDEIEWISSKAYAIKPLCKYPLMQAVYNLADALTTGADIDNDTTYKLFAQISPLCCLVRAQQIDDPSISEKILHSAVKRFDSCEWLAEYITSYFQYGWAQNSITSKVPHLYEKYILKINQQLKTPFSSSFIQKCTQRRGISIAALGNPRSIGGSCYVASISGYNIMLDCGIKPGKVGQEAYPNFESVKSDIDTIIITHAHIDHSGSIAKAHSIWPNATIFSTPATKAMLEPILLVMSNDEQHDGERDLENIPIEVSIANETFKSIIPVEYLNWIQISDVAKFRLHCAGHLLGAAIIELSINGYTVIYTGDFCIHSQELVSGAKVFELPKNPDLLISESTYMLSDVNKNWSEQRIALQEAICKDINNGKVVLLPASAMGKCQELICLVSDMIDTGAIKESTPIYIGGFAKKTCAALVGQLNEKYRDILDKAVPYEDDSMPEQGSIIIASSSSMQKSSASYSIAIKMKKAYKRGFSILSTEWVDNDSFSQFRSQIESGGVFPLSIHASNDEITNLVEYLNPKSLALVHWGDKNWAQQTNVMDQIRKRMNGDVITILFDNEQPVQIFDLKKWIEGEISNYEY